MRLDDRTRIPILRANAASTFAMCPEYAISEFKGKGYRDAMGARPMEGAVQRFMNNAYCDLLIQCTKNDQPFPNDVVVESRAVFG